MKKEEFLQLNWNDSHVGYAILVGDLRKIEYMEAIDGWKTLCLTTEKCVYPGKSFVTPDDVLKMFDSFPSFKDVIVKIDGEYYDLCPNYEVNGVDEQICFAISTTSIREKED